MLTLHFELSNESDADRILLSDRVATAVRNTPLETERDFHTAVNNWLNRITGTNPQLHRSTAQAIAESAINPHISLDDVFARQDTVRKTSFYRTKSPWVHDPEYRFILEVLVALYRQWDAGTAVRETMERQADWRKRMMEQADLIVGQSDAVYIKAMEALNDFISPTEITYPHIIQALTAKTNAIIGADKLARLALGMDTDQQALHVQAEVTETDTAAIRESMKDKLRQIGIGLRRPSAEPVEEKSDEQ